MSGVIALGYIGWEVSDILAWEELMSEVFGLELRTDGLDNTRHYRVDTRHHRISLYPGKQDRVRYIGWEVDSAEDLEIISTRLKKSGVKVTRATREQLDKRGGRSLHASRFELFGKKGMSLKKHHQLSRSRLYL